MASLEHLARMMMAAPTISPRPSHSAVLRAHAPLPSASHMRKRSSQRSNLTLVMAERHDEEGNAAENSSEFSASQIPDYLPSSSGDWREFRAKLVSLQSSSDSQADSGDMWAHPVPLPEPGCILVAHPLMFASSQQYFFQAVILVFHHDEAQGSCGLILNRPTQYTIGKIEGLEALRPAFSDSPLYLGGDVGENTLHCLHSYELPGSLEVVHGVRIGGIDAAKAMIERGELDQKTFKFLSRYAGWRPGQLRQECASGVWLTAAASPSFILQHDKHGSEMWHQALQMMGGEFKQMSEAMTDSYDPSVMEYRAEEQQDGQA